MKQEHVDAAIDVAASSAFVTYEDLQHRKPLVGFERTKAAAAVTVFLFLTELLGGASWWERPVILLVRGFVVKWMRARGLPIPGEG